MTRRWPVALLGVCFVLSGCVGPPASIPTQATAPTQTASATPAPTTAAPVAARVSPTTDQVAAVPSSAQVPSLTPDQSFLNDLRQHSPDAVTSHDATLITLGTTFCTQLRAGTPAYWVMTDMIKNLSGAYFSGTITETQESQMAMDFADIDRMATKHYCPEQMTQVMAAFLQEAKAGSGAG